MSFLQVRAANLYNMATDDLQSADWPSGYATGLSLTNGGTHTAPGGKPIMGYGRYAPEPGQQVAVGAVGVAGLSADSAAADHSALD